MVATLSLLTFMQIVGCGAPAVPATNPKEPAKQEVSHLFSLSKCWGKGFEAYEKYLGKPSNTAQIEGADIRTYQTPAAFEGKLSVVRLIVDPKFGKAGVVGVVTIIVEKRATVSYKELFPLIGVNSGGLKTTRSKTGSDRVLLLTGLKADTLVSGTVKQTARGADNAGDGDFSAWWQSDSHGSFLQFEIPSK